jgi:hypothetical protein
MALIGIDFDHTIRKEDNTECEGARANISKLRELGHKVLIHSCNNPKFIEKWMNDHDIRYDYIWDLNAAKDDSSRGEAKPVCALYIDDRAYAFPKDGSWHEHLIPILKRLDERGDPQGGPR